MTESDVCLPPVTSQMVNTVFRRLQRHMGETEGEEVSKEERVREGLHRGLLELWEELDAKPPKPEIYVTKREYEVVQLLANRNFQYKQIAAALNLSISTIRSHIHKVYCKLDPVKRNRGYVAKIFLEGKVGLQE
jgi:ATP/maltotriose-dependent transcriptional regulator MalT